MPAHDTPPAEIDIDADLVRRLLADQHPDLARRLKGKVLAWRKSLPKLTPIGQPVSNPEGGVAPPRARE